MFWIPIVMMIAGAAMQQKASRDAAKRAEAETKRALARQAEMQKQAEEKAMGQVEEYRTEKRADKQKEVETQLTEEFARPAEAAQTINQNAATTQGEVSKDYLTAKAASDANQMKMARSLAGLMAKQTGANRLRQNEAISMGNTAADIDLIANFSRGNAAVDELAIRHAAKPNSGLMTAGSLMQKVGAMWLGGMAGGAGAAGGAGGAGVGEVPAWAGGINGMAGTPPPISPNLA